ncbi:MAG: hypothetical protein JNM94_15830 [Phycisphaerae bacterium]|nr:hypothetical protein [Phycisphaerae bacterium]
MTFDASAFADALRRRNEELRLGTDDAEVSVAQLRRSRRRLRRDGRQEGQFVLTLVRRDGVLRWEESLVRPARSPRRRAGSVGGGALSADDEIVATIPFETRPPNQIVSLLDKADGVLSPERGVHELVATGGATPSFKWRRLTGAAPDKRTLLLVHGTFSSLGNVEKGWAGDKAGFFAWAKANYDQVLGFGHPTLGVSPILNAVALERELGHLTEEIDVIAHSRGGLVTRWWLDGVGTPSAARRRAVLVGSPMSGTSLASPARVRAVMGLVTNIASALETIGTVTTPAAPFMSFVSVLGSVLGGIAGTLAKLPIADAAISMVPGLQGQSRVGNNFELRELRARPQRAEYFSITSNFEPETSVWRFWRYFRKDVLLDLGADVVFGDETGIDGKKVGVENDLVVDTSSMTDLGTPFAEKRVRIYGPKDEVHHTAYFEKPDTYRAIRDWLS